MQIIGLLPKSAGSTSGTCCSLVKHLPAGEGSVMQTLRFLDFDRLASGRSDDPLLARRLDLMLVHTDQVAENLLCVLAQQRRTADLDG